MKKLLLVLSLSFSFVAAHAQYILIENFDTVPGIGWTRTNQSEPVGIGTWRQGVTTQFDAGAFNGDPTSFAMVNSASAQGNGTISNWLISPNISLENGDVIRFFSRVGLPVGQVAVTFPDRLEMRISTNGVATALPSGANSVGDFTTLCLTINEALTTTGYPTSWTLYEYTISGLSAPTDCKIALRYFVTNGGTQGTNSNIVGVDLFSIERTLGTEDFFKRHFTIFPNPANEVLTIKNNDNTVFNSVLVTDVNGRTIKQFSNKVSEMQINIADLASGVYCVKVISDQGSGTAKIVKN
ncbi:choice-of-anchor J domain-containing protein [Flavobacterium sp.]|uniref:T9SS type A sorting domain-containing protein n=1 Tax=Flavobacterium sp. TaxID=239 RepID=UPI0039E36256